MCGMATTVAIVFFIRDYLKQNLMILDRQKEVNHGPFRIQCNYTTNIRTGNARTMIHIKTTDAKYFKFDEFRREITNYEGDGTNVVIPATIFGKEVVSIGPDAFWNKGLTSVSFRRRCRSLGFTPLRLTNSKTCVFRKGSP